MLHVKCQKWYISKYLYVSVVCYFLSLWCIAGVLSYVYIKYVLYATCNLLSRDWLSVVTLSWYDMGEVISYDQTSNISSMLVGNKIVDHSGSFGASPVGTAPTASSFST